MSNEFYIILAITEMIAIFVVLFFNSFLLTQNDELYKKCNQLLNDLNSSQDKRAEILNEWKNSQQMNRRLLDFIDKLQRKIQ